MAGGKSNAGKADGYFRIHSDFYVPPPQFSGCFTSFYHMSLTVDDGRTVRDFLQPEWGNIRFFYGSRPTAKIAGSQINDVCFNAAGPSSLPCEFELSSAEMWGIGFLPLGWARFVDGEAHGLANTIWDGAAHPAFAKFATLSEALGDPQATREEQLGIITETLDRLMRPNRDEQKILRVHQAIVDGAYPAVGDLAEACGMSLRTLERVCRRYFGFTPKKLMRRQRFTRSLASFMLHKDSRWTEAMDGDYHDQAQFTREFHEFMTMNPSEYAALEHPVLASFMEARARLLGSASMALDRPDR